jgi:hypothetical protein
MNPRNKEPLELHIEELVLTGFPAGDRMRIAEAMERQLSRLLAERRFDLRGSIDLERIAGPAIDLAPNASTEVAGRQLGQAVFHGIRDAAAARPPRGQDRGTRR